jgi:hypothetical protein
VCSYIEAYLWSGGFLVVSGANNIFGIGLLQQLLLLLLALLYGLVEGECNWIYEYHPCQWQWLYVESQMICG